jgi:two-component sensor histidine kinase
LGITGIYFLIGITWILLSDHAISLIAPTPAAYAQLQTYKGTLYVVITTFLIFGLLNTYARAATDAVTSLKKTQQRLTMTLQEKEVLIRELHHRVRNNLQILAALLRLSGARVSGSTFQRRIETLSAMQDALEPQLEGEAVQLDTILHESVRLVAADAARRNIGIAETYDSLQVDPETGIRIGLVISELVANAVEHGYNGNGHGGRIEVTALRGDNELVLHVRDFGAGMPETDVSRDRMGPGLQISSALVEQMGGHWSFTTPVTGESGGTDVQVLFPLEVIS